LLTDLKISEFLDKTATGNAIPGGGSVAALAGALGAGLSEMVAHLTMGRKGYEAVDTEMKALAEEAERLRDNLSKNIDRDSEAYGEVLTAFKLPKDTEEEKEKRRQAIQKGFISAATVPLNVANAALNVIDLAEKAVKMGNKNTVTDGAVAALMARAAVISAVLNVKINLGSITDEEFKSDMKHQAEALEKAAKEKEKNILSKLEL
jgi:formiminotetrahydrofolate cyclodeaminase